ncbi:VOC family protein [Kitasatospora sp. NPDC058063]|uniref:VOC family protein n=1 Tax=unclassified Kitasatospora TaxID=2633591 RepID=UPI0036DEFB26
MSVTTTTHLNFRGSAREALDFYQSVFGGHTVAVTYKDAGNVQNENEADWVMWGQVANDNGFHVMAYDVPSAMPYEQGINPFFGVTWVLDVTAPYNG